jgi:hypothetical protein
VKAYLFTTGGLFVLITGLHTWEMVDRGRIYASDFIVIGLGAGLAVWAWRLVWQSRSEGREGR